MKQNSKAFHERISILTNSERNFIYGIPKFTNLERKHYFDLEKIEKDSIYEKLSATSSKVYFILQLGYFKFSHRFFKFSFDDVLEDFEYILALYFPAYSINTVNKNCERKTLLKHHAIILQLYSCRFPTKQDKENLFKKAKSVVSIDASPKYIFKEIVRFTSDNKIILPAYSTIQKLISKAITSFEYGIGYYNDLGYQYNRGTIEVSEKNTQTISEPTSLLLLGLGVYGLYRSRKKI